MARHILNHLATDLEGAFKLTETTILRTKAGEVYSIELGESLLAGSLPHVAQVTKVAPKLQHIGMCQGSTQEQVFNTAQNLVSRAVDDHAAQMAAAVPKPHRAVVAGAM